MDYDEDGDPILPPPDALRIPDLRGDVIVTGVRVERIENCAITRRGFPVLAIEATFQTTEGVLRTFWTRAEVAALAEGLRSVLCDA